MWHGILVGVMAVWALAACSGGSPPRPATAALMVSSPGSAVPLQPVDEAVDYCERFNREEAQRRAAGSACYCPCACVNGEISCAPCVVCEPSHGPVLEPDSE